MGALLDAYNLLKSGTLWSSTSKCKGYAVANPGEAAKIDAYVAALDVGTVVAPPVLATATGRGIVGMLAALASSQPAPTPTPTPTPSPAGTIYKTVDYSTSDLSQWDWGWQTSDPAGQFAAGPCSDTDKYATRGTMLPVVAGFNGYPHAAKIVLPANTCGFPNVAAEGLHKILNEGMAADYTAQLRVGQTVAYGWAGFVPSGQQLPTSFWGVMLQQLNYPGFAGAPLSLSLFRSGLASPAVGLVLQSGAWDGNSTSVFSGEPQIAPRGINVGPLYVIPSSMFAFDTWLQVIVEVTWATDSTGTLAGWARRRGDAWTNTIPKITGFPTLQYDAATKALPTPYGGSFTDKAGAYCTYNDGSNPAWTGPFTLYQGHALVKGSSVAAVEAVLT